MTVRDGIAHVRNPSPSTRRAIALLAVGGLSVAVVLSVRRSDIGWSDVRPAPLALLVALSTVPIALSAMEYRLIARMVEVDAGSRTALSVALAGFAANHLPLPGGAMLRVATLHRSGGVALGRATAATVSVGLTWLSVALVTGGMGIVAAQQTLLGSGLILAGVAAGGASWMAMRRLGPTAERRFMRVVLLEAGFLVVAIVRVLLAVRALGVDAELPQAAAMSAAGAISVAVGIVPGGIGVLEGLSAALASVVDLGGSIGLLTGTLMRLSGMVAAVALLPLVSLTRAEDEPIRSAEPQSESPKR